MQVPGSPRSFFMDTSCGVLLRELQQIWRDIGETEVDQDLMLLELEKKCLDIYQRKVDEASSARAQLHQTVAAKEAEIAALVAELGELNFKTQMNKKLTSLKEQLASINPLLESLKLKKEERIKKIAEIKAQIAKFNDEISGYQVNDAVSDQSEVDEHDLSLRKLNEFESHLRSLQKEKSDHLCKALEYVNEVHSLCSVLGLDFGKTVSEIHPALHETSPGNSTNISNSTLDGLCQTVFTLKLEKKHRVQQLKDLVASLFGLWNLMDSPEEEMIDFVRVTSILGSSEQEITDAGFLSEEIIEKTAAEVERLTKLKAGRMKELVLKKRAELEEICRRAHIEPDTSTDPEKSNAVMDSGIVDPSELLASIEAQIVRAREEITSRKEIMDRIEKWLTACEEEIWLEEYGQDNNRYSSGRGGHINLKRAEHARITVNKIPGMVDTLIKKTHAWEEERNSPFLYDGVRLLEVLKEYKLARKEKEDEKRRQRDQKKVQDMLLAEREIIYGSKSSPKRTNTLKKSNVVHTNGNRSITPTVRRLSASNQSSELLTPRSHPGHQNGYLKRIRRLSTGPLNFVAVPKEDTISSISFCGSESPSRGQILILSREQAPPV